MEDSLMEIILQYRLTETFHKPIFIKGINERD